MAGISEALVAIRSGIIHRHTGSRGVQLFCPGDQEDRYILENFAQFLLISFPRKEERGAHVFVAQGQ